MGSMEKPMELPSYEVPGQSMQFPFIYDCIFTGFLPFITTAKHVENLIKQSTVCNENRKDGVNNIFKMKLLQ